MLILYILLSIDKCSSIVLYSVYCAPEQLSFVIRHKWIYLTLHGIVNSLEYKKGNAVQSMCMCIEKGVVDIVKL